MINNELLNFNKKISSAYLPYNTEATFLELPFNNGNHQYLVVVNLSYSSSVYYQTVVLSINQVGNTVHIDKLAGSSLFNFSSNGTTIKCKQTYADTNLRAYGGYLIIN